MRERSPSDIRDAMLRQWDTIAAAIPALDLDRASRISGWRNREVISHLCLQPRLLVKFLASSSQEPPEMTLQHNLEGTRRLAAAIDDSARAEASGVSFTGAIASARRAIATADLSSTVKTIQGRIRLRDYLITRCIEGVVHGRDLVPPVTPDAGALAIAAEAFAAIAGERATTVSAEALVDAATGRVPPPPGLEDVFPIMG